MFTSNILSLVGLHIVTNPPYYKVVNMGTVKIKSNKRRKLEFTFDRFFMLNNNATYEFSINTNIMCQCNAKITHINSTTFSTYPIQYQKIIFKPTHTGHHKIVIYCNDDELHISSISMFHICDNIEARPR